MNSSSGQKSDNIDFMWAADANFFGTSEGLYLFSWYIYNNIFLRLEYFFHNSVYIEFAFKAFSAFTS